MKLKLNAKQINRVSEIYANLGVLCVGLFIIPNFTGEKFSATIILTGIVLSFALFIVRIIVLKRRIEK